MTADIQPRTTGSEADAGSGRAIGLGLLLVAALVFAMVLLGGATRLTNSGLSMVHWQFHGGLPPLSEADWSAEFERYKQFPEYRKVSRGMALGEFKRIYWFEYSHRMFGRFIGLAFAVPFVWFWLRGQVGRRLLLKLVVLFGLGGLQGLVGWWMVKSGLVDHPDVSHYRLSVHLGLAAILFAALIWVGVSELRGRRAVEERTTAGRHLAKLSALVCALTLAQLVLGGLVAGLNAGLVYNSFPTMGGHWIPPELSGLGFAGWFDEPVALQFSHRIGAYLLAAAGIVLWWRIRRTDEVDRGTRRAADAMLAVLALQFGLGIATLLSMVPLHLALAHQGGGLLLLASVVVLSRLITAPATGREGPA